MLVDKLFMTSTDTDAAHAIQEAMGFPSAAAAWTSNGLDSVLWGQPMAQLVPRELR